MSESLCVHGLFVCVCLCGCFLSVFVCVSFSSILCLSFGSPSLCLFAHVIVYMFMCVFANLCV